MISTILFIMISTILFIMIGIVADIKTLKVNISEFSFILQILKDKMVVC